MLEPLRSTPRRPPRQALSRVRTPAAVSRVARALLLGALGLLFGLVLLPWQQTAPGDGELIAFAPEDRQQVVDAPIKGVIVEWRVSEGDVVEAGQALAELRDNDADFSARLDAQADRVAEQLDAAQAKVAATELRRAAEVLAQQLSVAEYGQKVLEHRQKLVGEEAELDAARRNLDRISTLASEGIASTRDLEVARASATKAEAAVNARQAAIAGALQAQDKAEQGGASKIAKVEEELQAARASVADYASKVLEVETKQARQARQLVLAPRAGVVLRVHGGPGGAQVKEGDPLVTLVPDTSARAVALMIDGNDLPLVSPGEKVRLVFEGWPAIQFSGWPDLGRGTFGGRVAFVDATDNGKGGFRVVVVPDANSGPWPPEAQLRQGVRARGWVMLGRVRLGYELWRQINGFPALPPTDKDGAGVPANQKKPRASKDLKP